MKAAAVEGERYLMQAGARVICSRIIKFLAYANGNV